jgi:oligopeptide transport system ATP-binding protein
LEIESPLPETKDNVAVSVRDLAKTFYVGGGVFGGEQSEVSAVAGISFDIEFGRTLGLVGESGCGKSTTARCILRLIEPTSGEVVLQRNLDGGHMERIDIMSADRRQLSRLRQDMQIVFQDPFASLNPRMSVGQTLREPLHVHKSMTREEQDARVADLLGLVGLNPRIVDRYPHEFSGGQRQRIGVARALAFDPEFLVLDEPVSALDVSIQAQVLNLLEDLQDELGLTYLFIAHDIAVVRHICDDVAVMYLGKIVERAETDVLFNRPMHPYTQALLSAVPTPDPRKERQRERILLEGDVPSPRNPPSGCRFHTRCPIGKDKEICRAEEPLLQELESGHLVACHFPEVKEVI